VTYAKGCERWSNDQSMFAEAISTAQAADVAVVVVGTWSVSKIIEDAAAFLTVLA
jgi:beta-glucosidase